MCFKTPGGWLHWKAHLAENLNYLSFSYINFSSLVTFENQSFFHGCHRQPGRALTLRRGLSIERSLVRRAGRVCRQRRCSVFGSGGAVGIHHRARRFSARRLFGALMACRPHHPGPLAWQTRQPEQRSRQTWAIYENAATICIHIGWIWRCCSCCSEMEEQICSGIC